MQRITNRIQRASIRNFGSSDVTKVVRKNRVNIPPTSSTKNLDDLIKPQERTSFWNAKVRVKKQTPEGKLKFSKNVFLKPAYGRNLEEQLKNARIQESILTLMRENGLPALRSGAVVNEGQAFLAVESFLRKANTESKLIPINRRSVSSTPTFLKDLTVKNDSQLIKDLAKDLATIVDLGLSTPYFDFHGFYKRKDGSWKRVIMDVNNMHQTSFNSISAKSVITFIHQVWPPTSPEAVLFRNTLLKGIKEKTRRGYFKDAFKSTPAAKPTEGAFLKLLRAIFQSKK